MLEFLSSIDTRCVNASVCIITPVISATTICGVNISGTVATATNALCLGGSLADAYAKLDAPIFTGNVGVGGTATTKLDVLSPGSGYWNSSNDWTSQSPPLSTLTITNTSAGGYDPVLLFKQTSQGTPTTKNAGAIGLVGKSTWLESDPTTQISDMYFAVRNNAGGISERMRIRSDGSVQLKTIAGKTTETAVAFFKTDGTIVSGTSAGGSSQWTDITGGISYGCCVGIGTTEPLYLQHIAVPYVKTDTTQRIAAFFTSNETALSSPFGFRIGLKGGATLAGRTAILQTTDYNVADGGNIALQSTGGKVGIGTDEPDFLLTVGGDTTAASVIASINGPENQQKGLVLTSVGTTKWYMYNPASSADLRFFNGTADKMTLTTAGNFVVGEGTFTTLSGIPACGNMELTTQGGGLIVKDEISGTRWHIHTHSDRIRAYNGSVEQIYMTTTDVPAFATCVTSPVGDYKHLGAWGVARTAAGAILVNTAYCADYAACATNATNATNAVNATNLSGAGAITRTGAGTSYQYMIQVRETAGYGGNTSQSYAPSLGFHWGSVVASSIQMEPSGRISIRNNPGTSYEAFAAGVGTATDWVATSDCRLKKDIVPIENALLKTLALSGVCYHRHDDCTGSVHIGFLAQEVEKVIPEMVTREKASDIDAQYGITDEKLGLKYEKLTAILVEAIKEQQKQIDELQREVNNLKSNK